MRLSPAIFPLALAALGAALTLPVSATTMRRMDTRDLTLGSSEIVVGAVEATHPRWSSDHRKIFTDVDIRVSEALKGTATQKLTLTQLGGELDGMKYSIAGGPLFRPGEEALLFVWRDATGKAQVNGLAQGKFDITRDAKTGAATVQRSAPGFGVKDVRRLTSAPAGTTVPNLPLDDLKREIRRVLANPEAGR